MSTNQRVAAVPGNGLVYRVDDTVLIAGGETAPDQALAGELIAVMADASSEAGLRRLARILLDADDPPPVAVVTLGQNDTSVFVFGALDLVTSEGRTSGQGAVLGVNERVETGAGFAVVGNGGAVPELPSWASLGSGAVAGAGIVVEGAGSPTASAVTPSASEPVVEPSPEVSGEFEIPVPSDTDRDPAGGAEEIAGGAEEIAGGSEEIAGGAEEIAGGAEEIAGGGEDAAFEVISLGDDMDLGDREPLPVDAGSAGEADVTSEADSPTGGSDAPMYARPVEVLGVMSPRGHFNHPEARYCSRTGVKMGASHTKVLVKGERPPLGVITFDDGATYTVQWDTVLGRDPFMDDAVREQRAAALVVADDTQSVSRRHVLLELVDWDVLVSDLGSQNGTAIAVGDEDERLLGRGERVVMRTGTAVRFGNRSFVYNEHHVR